MKHIGVVLMVTVFLLTGCGPEKEPVRQLTRVTDDGVPVLAWFDPADGSVEILCGEERHGEVCPFHGLEGSYTSVGEKVFYFVEEGPGTGAEFYTYDISDGQRTITMTLEEATWRSGVTLRDGYLYRSQKTETGNFVVQSLTKTDLSTGNTFSVLEAGQPTYIHENTGYYAISDPDGYVCGVYAQPLFHDGEIVPPKELLLHEIHLGYYLLQPEGIYWTGRPFSEGEGPEYLYFYDFSSKISRKIGDAIPAYQFTGQGEYLYYLTDGLWRVGKTDGDTKNLYQAEEEGWVMKKASLAVLDHYVIADCEKDMIQGKLVYDILTETVQIYAVGFVE